MAARVLHILGTAEAAGASIAGMVQTLAQQLDRQEFQLDACFLGSPGPWIEALDEAGVATFGVPWPSPRDFAGALRFWRFLRRHPIDLLHVHYGGRSVRWLARAATRAPLIMHVHGYVRTESEPTPVPLRLSDVDAVIATSRRVAGIVQADRVTVVYPGVRLGKPSARRDPCTIGAAGRLVPIKGYDLLLEAFAILRGRLPDARLEIAGDGPARTDLEQAAQRLGIDAAVKFLGWRDDLPSLMERWSVFAQPSREEALGIAVLQAMAAGLPVVATGVGGLPEIVESGVTGILVPQQDTASFSDALARLLQNPELRARLSGDARRQAEHFSEARFADGIAHVYRDLLGPRAVPATSS